MLGLTTILQLAATALMPVLTTVIVYLCEKKTSFRKLKFMSRQIIIGIIFGGIAVISTEFGVNTGTAVMNVRDSAPLCAGIVFGAPAGIIAGIIGGVERWFATLWGASEYTRIACSIATVLAGLFSAILRKYMFDDKKPFWVYGFAVAGIMEIIHMLMLFLTNMYDLNFAFSVVQDCAIPMILLNSISVALALLAVSLISKEKFNQPHEQKHISQAVQFWLLICLIVAFIVGNLFTVFLQTKISDNENDTLLRLNIEDVMADIKDASDESLIAKAEMIAIDYATEYTDIKTLAEKYNATDINIVDKNGIIINSTTENYIGYNMKDGEQSAEFLVLLEGAKVYVQDYREASPNSEELIKYVGITLDEGGFIQVGFNAEMFQGDIAEQVLDAAKNRHVGKEGGIIICDAAWNIISDRTTDNNTLSIDKRRTDVVAGERFTANVFGADSYCMFSATEGYYVIAFLPIEEAHFAREVYIYVSGFMQILVFAILFGRLYFLIKSMIVENIRRINSSLAQIASGNLNVIVDVRSNQEFASLSDDINSTVHTLKRYISEAAARIDKELEFAKSIQHSALPSVNPYVNRKDFDIYADMFTAKEVGGDFYDFYQIDSHTFAILMADVSGKGIPAAMFMMRAKTLIKSLAETGMSVEEVFTQANEKLCAGNEAGMFVTAWLGFIDLSTGMVNIANAGHNPPLIKKANGEFEYLRTKKNLMLAGMEGINYRRIELQLMPGDQLFLYTDGVTEATNGQKELFGDDRLLETLNMVKDKNCEEICRSVKAAVDEFVGDAPQFDDITMLSLKIGHLINGGSITIIPDKSSVTAVLEHINKQMENLDIPPAIVGKVNIAVDELYSNIVKYSGAELAEIAVENHRTEFAITFWDNGKQFDPLAAKEPDVTAGIDERGIGGLGIFMVKKMAKSVDYCYEDGYNITRIIIEIKDDQ